MEGKEGSAKAGLEFQSCPVLSGEQRHQNHPQQRMPAEIPAAGMSELLQQPGKGWEKSSPVRLEGSEPL